MPQPIDWSPFYQRTKGAPPSELLVKALEFTGKREDALDVGGGALKDSRYLLQQGFTVTDLDNAPLAPELLAGIDLAKFQHVQSAYTDFPFPQKAYDIVSAMYSLPFNPPETFDSVLANIKRSLRPGAIFCGNFFGDRDTWNGDEGMAFHTQNEARKLLEGLEILSFQEREWNGKTATGPLKHWHTFEFITKKPS